MLFFKCLSFKIMAPNPKQTKADTRAVGVSEELWLHTGQHCTIHHGYLAALG